MPSDRRDTFSCLKQDNAKSVCFLYGTPLANFDYNDHHIYTHTEFVERQHSGWK